MCWLCIPQTVWPHLGLAVIAEAWCSFEVARQIWWPLQRKISLVRCPCACGLRRLAKTGCRGDLSCNRLVIVVARPGVVRIFEIPGKSLSPLWVCQIALVMTRRSFWNRSRNPLGTLGVSDHSRCGTVPILIITEILRRDLDKGCFLWKACAEIWCRDLAKRSLT